MGLGLPLTTGVGLSYYYNVDWKWWVVVLVWQ